MKLLRTGAHLTELCLLCAGSNQWNQKELITPCVLHSSWFGIALSHCAPAALVVFIRRLGNIRLKEVLIQLVSCFVSSPTKYNSLLIDRRAVGFLFSLNYYSSVWLSV